MNLHHHRATGLALILSVALTAIASAQNSLWLTHDASWRIEGRELVIEIANVTNPSTTEESGPLFLSIYAQPLIYEGAAPGQLIGRAAIDSIPAGGRADNVVVRTRLKAPRPGLKYTALMLERQTARNKYTIVDWVAFTSTYSFLRKQNGGVGSLDSAIGLGGIAVSDGELALTGRKAQLSVGRLQSQREFDRTGVLRLAIYANTEQEPGEAQNGQLLGSRLLGELAPGDFFHHLSATLLLKKPRPRGDYYITLLVEEDLGTGDGWQPVAVAAQVGPQSF